MKLIRKLEELPDELRRGAVSIGNFDGVHLGHARLVERLVSKAHEHDGPALVFTFDPHPAAVLRPDKVPPSLSWMQRKVDILGRLGVDMVVAFTATPSFFQNEPEEFFDEIILKHLESQAIVEGPNFYFGHDRRGDIRLLAELCRQHSLALDIVDPVVVDDQIVSSSRIRELVSHGEMAEANRLLVEPYRIRGVVVRGEGRGTQLGFPTINLERIDTLLPAEGIYAARAYTAGQAWTAAVNVGSNRTFNEEQLKVEAHLLDATGDFYDDEFEIEFIARLRELRKFASPDELVAQIRRDIAATNEIANSNVELDAQ